MCVHARGRLTDLKLLNYPFQKQKEPVFEPVNAKQEK